MIEFVIGLMTAAEMFTFAFLFQRNINENFITIIYTHHSKKANKVIETDSIYFLIFSEP